jgi:hypothetical protein
MKRKPDQIDVTVCDESEQEEENTILAVYATFCPRIPATRLDPEEPAGFDVDEMSLTVTDVIRGLDTESYGIRIQGQSTVWITLDKELLMTADQIDLDSLELRNAVSAHLMATI